MKLNRHGRLVSLALAFLLLLTTAGSVWAQVPLTRMRNVAIQVLSVTAGLTTDDLTTTDDVVVGDALTVVGNAVLSADAAVSGDTTLTGGMVVGTDLNVAAATTISVTMNATITPTGTYQPLESAGTVNTSSIAAGTAGDLLILTNTANTSIVFTDTGTLKLTGNITLGQYDTLELISDGTNWLQLGTANN